MYKGNGHAWPPAFLSSFMNNRLPAFTKEWTELWHTNTKKVWVFHSSIQIRYKGHSGKKYLYEVNDTKSLKTCTSK